MKNGKGVSLIFVDYFLILSAIIGVGFASGKEISVFFFDFGESSFIGLAVFCVLYIYLFFIISYIRRKMNLNYYSEFNKVIFGKLCYISNIILIINFVITSTGMLAGADYLFGTFFGIGYKIPSILLSVIVFFVLIGGIDKIKVVANCIIPVMIIILVINSVGNINFSNLNFDVITTEKTMMACYYALLFGVNNFVAALPVLFESKLKTRGRLLVIASIVAIILLNLLVFGSNKFFTDMPMYELSENLGKTFYFIYFGTIILALFSTLMICTYNTYNILKRGEKRDMFLAIVIILSSLILSNFGYAFIVKHMYALSGILSGIYIITLIVLIIIRLIKTKKSKR